MINFKLFFLCHSVYSDNGVFDPNYSITFGFLQKYFPFTPAIRHSLLDAGESRFYPKGIEKGFHRYRWLGRLPSPLRYISEVFFNFIVLFHWKPDVVLSIDPLCTFVPLLLKQMGLVRSVIFITPDFSERRFENSLMNWLYYRIDGFCTRKADINLCVSKLIIERKVLQYSINADKFYHLPNIPDPDNIACLNLNNKLPCSFIYVGNVSSQIDFSTTIEIIKKMQSIFPETSIHIVGGGDFLDGLKHQFLDDGVNNVTFYGILSHNETLSLISQCEYGIALYNGIFSYDKYRDSCKIREYQALSCIPITTSIVQSNADEIRNFGSGLFIENVEDLIKQLIELTQDDAKAKQLRENCQRNYMNYSSKYKEYQELIVQLTI